MEHGEKDQTIGSIMQCMACSAENHDEISSNARDTPHLNAKLSRFRTRLKEILLFLIRFCGVSFSVGWVEMLPSPKTDDALILEGFNNCLSANRNRGRKLFV